MAGSSHGERPSHQSPDAGIHQQRSIPQHPRRAIVAASIGNILEWYDFAVYGYTATILATVFFPQSDPTTALLATLAIFGVTFFGRPLGGVVFGHLGDRFGRRFTLTVTVISMGIATLFVGLLPSYAQIGLAAPILLTLLRLLQGFSAGGEFSGATSYLIEYAPDRSRGMWATLSPAASILAFTIAGLFSYLLTTHLTPADLHSWGWRIPFLCAAPLALAGLYVRLRIAETPAFRTIQAKRTVRTAPILSAVRNHLESIIVVFALSSLNAVGFYTMSTYMNTYLSNVIHLSRAEALLSSSIALLVYVVGGPLFGKLSDRVGRRPILLGGAAGVFALSVPAFLIIQIGTFVAATLGQVLVIIALSALGAGVVIFHVELFPTSVRYSGASIGYNLAYMIFGGTAPFMAAFLISTTGTSLIPAAYFMAITAATVIVVMLLGLVETRELNLVRGDDAGSDTATSIQTQSTL